MFHSKFSAAIQNCYCIFDILTVSAQNIYRKSRLCQEKEKKYILIQDKKNLFGIKGGAFIGVGGAGATKNVLDHVSTS